LKFQLDKRTVYLHLLGKYYLEGTKSLMQGAYIEATWNFQIVSELLKLPELAGFQNVKVLSQLNRALCLLRADFAVNKNVCTHLFEQLLDSV